MAGRKRIYQVNENFFEPPLTPESAYVMGYFVADGNFKVSMVKKKWPSYSICFSCHERDVALLHKVRGAMESTHPIKTRIMRGFVDFPLSTLAIHSKLLFHSLAETWGIPRNKSKEARLPGIPDHLMSHFARGLFDGDGYIGIYRKKDRNVNHRQFGFCGGPIINDIADTIHRLTGHRKEPKYRSRKSGSAWEVLYGSRDREVLVWLYKGATLYLERKHVIALQFLDETNPDA